MLKEFKDFILKGDLVEIAIGLILALKVKDLIDAFTKFIISPIIGAISGAPSFADKSFKIGKGVIAYGAFIDALIAFLIVAFILFLIIKAYNKAVEMAKRNRGADAADEPGEDIVLLREIRDGLRSRP